MDHPQTLPPAAQRTLAGVLRVAPKAVIRQMLRNMSTGEGTGPLSRFDAERLARERPSAKVLARPKVDPIRWPDARSAVLAGPLQGEAVIIKESLDIAGLPQSLGNHPAAAPIAQRDSVLVERIRKAGGRVLGKSIMTELGMDGLGVHLVHGVPNNPKAKGHFPGGSSTGTAVAVASGLARFGVGGDGLGSVRIPSGFCGLVGLKPTYGRLSVVGMQRDAPTLAVPGPMTRTANDCAILWAVLDGKQPPGRLRPLWPSSIGVINQLPPSLASADVRGAFDRALALLGCRVEKVDVKGAGASTTLAFMSAAYECARSPWAKLATEPTPRLVLTMGQRLNEADGAWVKGRRKELRAALLKALDRAGGFIIAPTTAVPAPAIDKQLLKGGLNLSLLRAVGCYAPLANATGVPAIAIPCGTDARGRPLSVQVFGKPDSEEDLLRIARSFEAI